MTNKLTSSQTAILDFLWLFLDENGSSPTVDEIAAAAECHVGNVSAKIRSLEFKGLVEIERHRGLYGMGFAVVRVNHPSRGLAEIEDIIQTEEGYCIYKSDADATTFKRNCMCCGKEFVTECKFYRLCGECRQDAGMSVDMSVVENYGADSYRSNTQAILNSHYSFGIGGFRKPGP